MKTSTKISVSFLAILLVIIIVAIVTLVMYKDYNKEAEKEVIDWENIYLEILKDEENFKGLTNIELQICDLDRDETPELITYGKKNSNNKIIAKVYKINKEEKIDTIQFELDENFTMKFLYNNEERFFAWYIVTEKNKLYDIKIEEKNYEIEKSNYDYEDFARVDEPKKIVVDLEEDKPREIIKKVKENYNDITKKYIKAEKELADKN